MGSGASSMKRAAQASKGLQVESSRGRKHISFETSTCSREMAPMGTRVGTRPCTQQSHGTASGRPGTQASKTSRPQTNNRPCTEYSQAITRPNTEYNAPSNRDVSPEVRVLAFNFGVERTSPPESDRIGTTSQVKEQSIQDSDVNVQSIVHFPAPDQNEKIVDDIDGKSSTTYASVSNQDAGSLPASRSQTPAGVGPSPRPGTRGFDASLEMTKEGEEEIMSFEDSNADNEYSRDSGTAWSQQCNGDDAQGPDENQDLPSPKSKSSTAATSKPSSRPTNTQLSLATTRTATGVSSKNLNLFAEEEYDEIERVRQKKAEKLRREMETLAAIRQKAAEVAPRVLKPANPEELIFEMHWGFPPRPRSDNELRPPTPPPAGWEEVVCANRRFRFAIRVTLSLWVERAMRRGFMRMHMAISDRKYYKERERLVCSRLNRWFRDILIPVFAEWADISKQMINMRKKTRKVLMMMMNKDTIRAWGAWVAVWAHKKDWRVCALKGCLHTRIKKSNKTETFLFAKAKRGESILHEFSTLTVTQLIEKVAASKVDIEAIHRYLTIEELMKQGVFKIDQKDKALKLVWKVDRLMREDTARLDHLAIWDGKMLLGVDIYLDEEEALREASKKNASKDDDVPEIRLMNIDLSAGGGNKESQQMNVANERMMESWAWGYIVYIHEGKTANGAKLQSVKAKLVCQEYGIAMVHVVDVNTQQEQWQSEIKNGLGPDEQWYEFEFGQYDEEGNYQQLFLDWQNYAVVVSISDRGDKASSQANPCKFVFHLDHRPERKLNDNVTIRPGSFDGRWNFTPSSRNVELQVLLRVDENFGRDEEEPEAEEPTPTSYEKGVQQVQAAHREIEEMLRKLRKGATVDSKVLEEKRILLRRLALSACDEMFEQRLSYVHSRKLMLDAPTHSTCAYHPKMQEYWMLDQEDQLNFLIAGIDGRLRRDVRLMSMDNLKIFSFCFSIIGDLFIANNQNTFYRYIAVDRDLCDTYLRMWKVELHAPPEHKSWENASGVACHDDMIFGIFKYGPIVQLSQASGAVQRVIPLKFEVANVEQMCFVMHRFVIVDAHTVKVCSLDGEIVWVPLGPQGNVNDGILAEDNPNAKKLGYGTDDHGSKVTNWRSYIENGMDRPRIMWDGSFLWITETHLRKTDDTQLRMRHFMWHCFAPMTWPEHLATAPGASRAYGRRKYVDLSVYWDSSGKLHSAERDFKVDITPGTNAIDTPSSLTKSRDSVSPQFSRQNSSNYGVAPKDHDKTHFKRPVSPVEEHADDRAEGEDGDERFIQPFPTNESNTLSVAF